MAKPLTSYFRRFGSGTSQTVLDRYNYKSYAIFEDDPANPGAVKQLTPWRILPTGVSLLSESLGALAPLRFTFTPMVRPQASCFRILNSPLTVESIPHLRRYLLLGQFRFGIFEGYVNGKRR